MRHVLSLVILLAGCTVATDAPAPTATPQTNPYSEGFADWTIVDCPRCNGTGQIQIDRNHPLHAWGVPVGPYTCDLCNGDCKMLTNGRGVYTNAPRKP